MSCDDYYDQDVICSDLELFVELSSWFVLNDDRLRPQIWQGSGFILLHFVRPSSSVAVKRRMCVCMFTMLSLRRAADPHEGFANNANCYVTTCPLSHRPSL